MAVTWIGWSQQLVLPCGAPLITSMQMGHSASPAFARVGKEGRDKFGLVLGAVIKTLAPKTLDAQSIEGCAALLSAMTALTHTKGGTTGLTGYLQSIAEVTTYFLQDGGIFGHDVLE